MEREPIQQSVVSGALIAIAIIIVYFSNAFPTFSPGSDCPINSSAIFGLALASGAILGTLTSQITISTWSTAIGFSAIDYSTIFQKYGSKKVVQAVFDKYVHGTYLGNKKEREWLPKTIRDYARRRVAVYWLNLVAVWTSMVVIAASLVIHIITHNSTVLILLIYVIIIGISLKHMKHVKFELFAAQEFYLKPFKQAIINEIKNFRTVYPWT